MREGGEESAMAWASPVVSEDGCREAKYGRGPSLPAQFRGKKRRQGQGKDATDLSMRTPAGRVEDNEREQLQSRVVRGWTATGSHASAPTTAGTVPSTISGRQLESAEDEMTLLGVCINRLSPDKVRGPTP